jgi:hypothetical protein
MMTHKEAYFMAKKQMTDALDYRMSLYEELLVEYEQQGNINYYRMTEVRIQELNQFRDFVRNGMLWDTKHDKKQESKPT